MKLVTRYRGGALLSTVIVAFILLLFCSMLLLLLYNFKKLEVNDCIQTRLKDNIASGIQMSLAQRDYSQPDRWCTDISLWVTSDDDSVAVKKQFWGTLQLAQVQVAVRGRRTSSFFLYGAAEHPFSDGCLFLADHKRTLSLVGRTILRGKVYLPEAGVKAGYINQKGFDGSQLIAGETDTSMAELPLLTNAFTGYCNQMLACVTDSMALANGLYASDNGEDSIENSFGNSVKYLGGDDELRLDNLCVKGKVVITSAKSIEVAANCRLENVILVAPYVKFETGFSGNVHVFATDSIVAANRCTFSYPSSFVVRAPAHTVLPSAVRMYEHVDFNGSIFCLNTEKNTMLPHVYLERNCIVRGLAYVNGYLHHDGWIEGNVFADYFLLNKGAFIYDDMLEDAAIVYGKAALYNLLSPLSKAGKNKVVKWLY